MELSKIKPHFPIFESHPDLTYLDSAASSQKPRVVIEAISNFYTHNYASINRGLYQLGAETTQRYEGVRAKVAEFIGAAQDREIIYTSGTTESINLVAQAFLAPQLKAGDEVLITAMEHHANLIPWQELCRSKQAKLLVAPIDKKGILLLEEFQSLISPRTKMIALTHISNALGTINPIKKLIQIAHQQQPLIPVLIDAAQSAAHYPLDVQDLDCDFLVFSGHKVFGPTGIGVLYAKQAHLENMQPIRFGGDMIESVSFQQSSYASYPRRFEAGTTNIAGVIGLGAALDFVQSLDRIAVLQELAALRKLAEESLQEIEGLHIIGQAAQKSALISFNLGEIHPHDMATFLGTDQVAIRAGHHCTQPLMDAWGLPGTVRASFSVYNTVADIERLVASVQKVKTFFG